MSNETCPHCGAEKQVKPHDGYKPWRYDCGTLIHTGERLKANCYERQLAAKDEEIDILNTKIALLEDEVKRLRGEVK